MWRGVTATVVKESHLPRLLVQELWKEPSCVLLYLIFEIKPGYERFSLKKQGAGTRQPSKPSPMGLS